MTFSIAARSDDGRLYGVAVASKFLAVGSAVPAAEAGVGAIATQAYANLTFGPRGLTMLRTGASADETVAGLVAADPGRAQRQVGVVGASGGGATYTGDGCSDWAGGHAGDGFALQGNILAGPAVVDAMRDTWVSETRVPDTRGSTSGRPFAERLLATLLAGDRAGGDRRGRQSAALFVVGKGEGYGGTSDVAIDLRVDDHADPVPELERLLGLHRLYFGTPDPRDLLELTGEVADEVGALLRGLGHEPAAGLERALEDWAGVANLEERMVPGRIDRLVLEQLRQAYGMSQADRKNDR